MSPEDIADNARAYALGVQAGMHGNKMIIPWLGENHGRMDLWREGYKDGEKKVEELRLRKQLASKGRSKKDRLKANGWKKNKFTGKLYKLKYGSAKSEAHAYQVLRRRLKDELANQARDPSQALRSRESLCRELLKIEPLYGFSWRCGS